ncbi:MAG: tyrosine-protein phosphatase [Arcticibacter sp.]|jgi:tyrosine-protein phosphatase YwqE
MGLFDIFKKKSPPLADYSLLGTDMHSHLLPGLDDGAPDIETSMKLIRDLHEMGFRKFWCTPHIMSDFYKNDSSTIIPALESVREAVKEQGIPVEVFAAAEYYVDEGFVKKLENEKLLTLGDKHLLFEVSYINAPENLSQVIFNMQLKGYRPIMAHPERYPFWYRDFEKYKTFRDSGVLMQVNMNSISGYYGPDARAIALKMIDEGIVDLLGTDCHHDRHVEGLRRGLKEPAMRKLIEQTALFNASL